MQTNTTAVQLPFEGLVIAPDETVIGGLEVVVPDKGTMLLILTERNIHVVPLTFFGVSTVRSVPLASVVGAYKPPMMAGVMLKCEYGGLGLSLVPRSNPRNVAPIISFLNMAFRVFCAKELTAVGDKWEMKSTSLGDDAKQEMLEQIKTLKQDFIAKYTNPDFVHSLNRRKARMRMLWGCLCLPFVLVGAIYLTIVIVYWIKKGVSILP